MSHITTCTTEIQSLKDIESACEFLGLKYQVDTKIRKWQGYESADLVIKSPGNYDIGVKQKNGKFILFADSMAWAEFASKKKLKHMKFVTEESFLGIIMQAIALTKAITEAENLGHRIAYSEPDSEGIIHARVEVD